VLRKIRKTRVTDLRTVYRKPGLVAVIEFSYSKTCMVLELIWRHTIGMVYQ